jgi:hypothetical protein
MRIMLVPACDSMNGSIILVSRFDPSEEDWYDAHEGFGWVSTYRMSGPAATQLSMDQVAVPGYST